MAYKMPKDFTGAPIPCLSLKDGGAHHVSLTIVTARNATAMAADTRNANKGGIVIAVYCDVDFFISFGDVTVEAAVTDYFMPGGVYYNFALDNSQTHVAGILASGTGTLHISEMV